LGAEFEGWRSEENRERRSVATDDWRHLLRGRQPPRRRYDV